MENRFKLLTNTFGEDRFKKNEPIKYHAESGVGGIVKLFTIVFSERELVKMIEICRELSIPLLLMGSGSKLIVSDQGFDGVVIKNRTKNIQTISVKGKVTRDGIGVEEAYIEVDSGLTMGKFVEFLISQKLSIQGLESIKGTIGGNIFTDSFLQSMVKSIKVLTRESDIEKIKADSLSLDEHIVLSVVFNIKAE